METRIGYHGTTRANAASIVSSGFDRSDASKMLGAGVYWSDDVSKAVAYGNGEAILKLEVRPGLVKKIDRQGHPQQKTWQATHHTAWVPPGCGMVPSGLSENCTYDPSRIKVIGVSTDRGATWRLPQDDEPRRASASDYEELRRRHGIGTVYADFAYVPTRASVTRSSGSGVKWDLDPRSPGFGTGWY